MTESETRRRVDELHRLVDAGILTQQRFVDMATRAFQLATPNPMVVGPDGRIISRAQEKPMQTGATVETGLIPLAVGQVRSENGAQYLVTRKCPEDRWDIEWLNDPRGNIRGNHSSRFLICDPFVKETAVVSAERLSRVTTAEPREPTMEEMKAFAADPYNHHDWAKYLPREMVPHRSGKQDMRVGDVWAGMVDNDRKPYVLKVISTNGWGAAVETLAGERGYTTPAFDSLVAQHARLIARMENGVLLLMPGFGIDKPADVEREAGVDRCGWRTTDGMQCAGFHGHGYLHNTDPAWWVKRGIATPMVHFVADPNLRPAPKPDFHGVKVGEWRKTKQGWGEVIGMDAGTKTCRLRFPGNLGHLDEHYDLQWISKQGVSNLPPAPASPRCKTGTACKSPADAPLGYMGLCWRCTLVEEKRKCDVMKAGDEQRARVRLFAIPERTFYDNSRSAGIGVAGTIWRLR